MSQIESKGKDSTTITLARSMEEDAFDYHARGGVTVMQSRVSATHCRTRMPLPHRTLAWPAKSYHNVLSYIPRLTTIVSTQRLHAATYVCRACIASRRRACCRIALPCTNVNTFAACETKQKKSPCVSPLVGVVTPWCRTFHPMDAERCQDLVRNPKQSVPALKIKTRNIFTCQNNPQFSQLAFSWWRCVRFRAT